MPDIKNEQIFVIYDSKAIAETISLFGKEKYRNISEIDNPELATDFIRSKKPKACILCAMTGKTKVFKLCKEIKNDDELKEIIVVILSMQPDKAHQEAKDVRADMLLELSTPADEILSGIDNILNNNSVNDIALSDLYKRLEAAEEKIENLEKILKGIINYQ